MYYAENRKSSLSIRVQWRNEWAEIAILLVPIGFFACVVAAQSCQDRLGSGSWGKREKREKGIIHRLVFAPSFSV